MVTTVGIWFGRTIMRKYLYSCEIYKQYCILYLPVYTVAFEFELEERTSSDTTV